MQKDNRPDRNDRVSLGDTDSLNTTAAGQLVHFDDLDDFKIADGEPDIRGWDVRGTDGEKIGKVEDLLVDTSAMKVRYIEVRLDKEIARQVAANADLGTHHIPQVGHSVDDIVTSDDRKSNADAERYVLVPIGVARLDDDHDDVLLDAHAQQMVGIPSYAGGALTRDHETDIVRSYDAASGGTAESDVMRAARPADVQPGRMEHDHADLKTSHDIPSQATPKPDAFYADRSFDDRSFFGSRRRGRDNDAYFTRTDPSGITQDALDWRGTDMDDMSERILTDEQMRERQRTRTEGESRSDM